MRSNPVFWLMWLLPGAAVVASFATLGIALRSGDRPLPEVYHWEGVALERDFARAQRAAALGIDVRVSIDDAHCTATLRNAPGDPPALNLLLTSSADASLDRAIRLRRSAPGEYRADCAALPTGRWRVALDDDAREWSLRGLIAGTVTHFTLGAPRADP